MKVVVFFLMCLSFVPVFGQDNNSGAIKGKISDAVTSESLFGIQVNLTGTDFRTESDMEGEYVFRDLDPGVYSISIQDMSYAPITITEITVVKGETTVVDISLEIPSDTNSQQLAGAVITARRNQESVNTLYHNQMNSSSVSDGVSAQILKTMPVRTSADALKVVSGASIQDNKFAVIRGLNDRYNAAYLNGGALPSSEADRKAFSFDIFPANMLEQLVISKTATPDQPAEFAGGVIQITTKSIPNKKFFSVSGGAGYNTITTFKTQQTYEGGKSDWIGVDDGSRSIPSAIPAYGDYPINIKEQAALAQQFSTNWNLTDKKFSPNYNFQIASGFNPLIFKKEVGIVTSLTYNRSFSYTETARRGYTNGSTGGAGESQLDYDYLDKNNVESVLAGAMANFFIKLNDKNSIGFKNLYSINSDDKLINRTGEINPLESNPNLLRSNARWFTSNKVYSGQLSGDHLLSDSSKIKMSWLVSYSNINRTIPSLNRSIYTRLKYLNDPFDPNPRDTQWVANISSTNVGPSYGGGMFFSENQENSTSAKLDFTVPFVVGKRIRSEFKFGGMSQLRDRKFQARQLGYTKYGIVGGAVMFDESLLYLPEDQIFNPENMGLISEGADGNPGKGGFKITDGTKFSDAYDAGSTLHAGYLMLDNRFGTKRERENGGTGLRLVYGARAEYFNQVLTAKRDNNLPLELNTKKLDILPSVNAIYSITANQNMRLSYSQTINRPEYRELAPFAFYDFTTNFVVSGNDSLQRAKIQNVDARYEIYPGNGQVFSATLFYKHFENPIEQISRPDVTSEISYKNVPSAQNYGLELEARLQVSSLIRVDTGSFFTRMTVFSNLAIIRSLVDVSHVVGAIDDTRPLQGQSPYVFNAGLNYMNPSTNWGVSVNVNRVGPRIAIVGNVNEPDLWENARTFLDVQLTKSFLEGRAEIKLNAANILAQKQDFYQNNDSDDKAKGIQSVLNTIIIGDKQNKTGLNRSSDDVVWSTKYGPTLSFTFTYKF